MYLSIEKVEYRMQIITLTVDGKTAKVKPGATILDAANAVGVKIPTLCHDNKLHPFGARRICIVEVQGTPRKFTPSCTTPAVEGMVVDRKSTRLNSSHGYISYAVFFFKKKK